MIKRDGLNRYWLIALGIISVIIVAFTFLNSSKQSNDFVDISPYALLNTSDVQSEVKRSVVNNNPELLHELIQRIVDVANEMPLAPKDIAFLKSDEAQQYLLFQAKRALFDDELTQRFESLQPILDLKTLYPEAQDKFARADKMIERRDNLFSQIKGSLITSGLSPQQAEVEAKKQWLQRFNH